MASRSIRLLRLPMANPNGRKGSKFETDVLKWLRQTKDVLAERLTKAGAKDEGDLVCIVAGKTYILELKNRATLSLPESVTLDANLSWDLLQPGGIMAFDDYEWDHPDGTDKNPKPAIDAWLNEHKDEFELIRKGWQVWIRKK